MANDKPRGLSQNVHAVDPETGQGKWYGPDYPDAGDPPKGTVTNEAAYASVDPAELMARENLEGEADDTRGGIEGNDDATGGKDGADKTGDPTRRRETVSFDTPRRAQGRR